MKKILTPLVLITALSHSVQANDTASIQWYTRDSTTRTLSINSSKESLEKSLPEIIQILQKSYKNQWNQTYSLDEAFRITKNICNEISWALMKNGITKIVGQKELISFFTKQWYSFTISPISIGGDRYIVNHPIYKLWKTESYDMSAIRFDMKYHLPIQEIWVSANLVDQTLIPDFRKINTWFELDGLTISDPVNKTSSLLLFPEKIREKAREINQDPIEYKKVVVMNEIGQIYLENLIPAKLFWVELSSIDIPGPKWITIHHMIEAFSDLCSIKFSNWWKSEIFRIILSNDEWYRLSRMILSVHLKQFFPMIKPDWIMQKIQSMNPDEYKKLNDYIIEWYEENLLPTISSIHLVLSQK